MKKVLLPSASSRASHPLLCSRMGAALYLHRMQQGWQLLNREAMNVDPMVQLRASYLPFLLASFARLGQQSFFSSRWPVAFFRQWSHSDALVGWMHLPLIGTFIPANVVENAFFMLFYRCWGLLTAVVEWLERVSLNWEIIILSIYRSTSIEDVSVRRSHGL